MARALTNGAKSGDDSGNGASPTTDTGNDASPTAGTGNGVSLISMLGQAGMSTTTGAGNDVSHTTGTWNGQSQRKTNVMQELNCWSLVSEYSRYKPPDMKSPLYLNIDKPKRDLQLMFVVWFTLRRPLVPGP